MCHRYAEHMGKFDILVSVLRHIKDYQKGMGVVAVSPR